MSAKMQFSCKICSHDSIEQTHIDEQKAGTAGKIIDSVILYDRVLLDFSWCLSCVVL